MMTLELWKLVAAIGGVLVTVVTGPIIWAVKAELGKLRAEIRAEISASESRLKVEIVGLQGKIEKQMVEMEARLNQRIDTHLVHR